VEICPNEVCDTSFLVAAPMPLVLNIVPVLHP